MAMDFWAAQRRARSKTKLYVFIFVILTLLVAFLAELAMRTFAEDSYHTNVPVIGLIFAGVTFGVAAFEYSMYMSFGGAYVAESVGAVRVDPQTTNFKEKQLLNIVQEMSVAAALPIPAVYILNTDEINAFAAGLGHHDAAVAITRGALNLLKREEIQGVIAHEIGHIYNGDMKISMRLAAMVMGFFFVLYIALRIFQFTSFNNRRSDGDKKGNPLLIAAIIFMIAGAITWLFGSILKAAVSREREYLADACSVQFTRNPEAISNALRKIAQTSVNKMPKSGMAYSHLYFDNHVGLSALFATHPPIAKRIEAIEGRKYIPDNWVEPKDQPVTGQDA